MWLYLSILCLSLSFIPTTLAVYADDAYNTDYHHELLGLPQPHTTFFHRPRQEDKATLLYTLSDLGVIGAVNPAKGQVVWRQFLAGQNQTGSSTFLRPVEGAGTIISAGGGRVDAWDALNGRKQWNNAFSGSVKDLEIMETVPGGVETRSILVLFEDHGRTVLRMLDGTTGDVLWEYWDTSGDQPHQVSTNVGAVFVVSLHGSRGGYNLKVAILDAVTGRKTSEYALGSKSDVHTPEDVLLVGANSASPIIAWTDKGMHHLKVNVLGKSTAVQSLPLKESDGVLTKVELHAPHLIQSLPHFLVHSFSTTSNRADVFHINLGNGNIEKAYELPKLQGSGTVSTSSQEANVYFTRITEDEVIIVSSASHGVLRRFPVILNKDHGDFVHGVSEVVHKGGDTYASRSAVLTTDEDWVLVRNGNEEWTRVEGLSGAVAAAWAEVPESEILAKTLEAEADSNPVSAFVHRVRRHITSLQHLPAYLAELPARLLGSIIAVESPTQQPSALTRDTFGFNRIIIISSERGRLYALDAANEGSVIWNSKAYNLPPGSVWDVIDITVDNTLGLATIRGATGEYITVNVTTGVHIERTERNALPTIHSVATVRTANGKWVLTIGTDGSLGDIPIHSAPLDIVVVQVDNELRGLKFENAGTAAAPLIAWRFQPMPGQRIVNIVSRGTHDPVASIGRVLGDRTVLYKYLNPNLVLATAISYESSTASFYLIDSVSGTILHTVCHEGVDSQHSITTAITENWFAYSLWGDLSSGVALLPGSKGYQIVITELFESPLPNYRGPLGPTDNSSSFEPSEIPNADPALPHVSVQSFLISQPVSHMAVTQTGQGITTRQLLCTLPSLNAIVGIPRTILDPRRPVGRDPTSSEMEEGLFRYSPVIELDPKLFLSHDREVLGIRDVITTPALLESTSLVFAYGIDIFGTRVAPSAAFDILGKGFNKLSLMATVLGLAGAVALLAPMVRRKQINGRWVNS